MKALKIIALLLVAGSCAWAQGWPGKKALIASLRQSSTTTNTIPASGLVAWLKADSISGDNGSTVTSWADSSGLGNTPTNSVTIPYVTNNVVNGYAGLYFDGSDYLDWSYTAMTNAHRNKNGATLFFVMRQDVAEATKYSYWSTTSSSSSLRLAFFSSNTPSFFLISSRRQDGFSADTSAPISYTPGFALYSIVVDWSDSALYVYTNGVSAYTDTDFNTIGTTTDTAAAKVYLGGGNTAATRMKATYAEVIIYNNKLSDTDRIAVESYVSNKFRIWP